MRAMPKGRRGTFGGRWSAFRARSGMRTISPMTYALHLLRTMGMTLRLYLACFRTLNGLS